MISDFSTLLKACRIKAKLSQKELAEKAGTTPALISKYELGKVMPRTETIAKLAAVLHVPLEDMLNSVSAFDVRSPVVSIPIGNNRELFLSEEELRKHGLNPLNLLAIEQQGDAMRPILNDEDVFLVDVSKQKVSDGKIYAISDKESKIIRSYMLMNLLDGSLRLVSFSPHYPDMDVNRDDIEIIGEIVWRSGFIIR